MEKAVAVAKEEFAVIRTGRAHPAMFSKITAEYYGTPTPVNQLASFHIPEPRMVVIQPFDKSSLAAIEKAVRNSDLGVNPANDGTIIRVVFPELSEERRREYIKVARHKAEDSRVSIRNIRRHAKDALDKLVKGGDAGEDEAHRAEPACRVHRRRGHGRARHSHAVHGEGHLPGLCGRGGGGRAVGVVPRRGRAADSAAGPAGGGRGRLGAR